MTCAKVVVSMCALALLSGIVYTHGNVQDKTAKGEDKASAEAKPSTHKVEKKPFRIEVALKGILEAKQTAEISFRPLPTVQHNPSLPQLTIRQIVNHGAAVKKGDMLLTLDPTKINEVIDEAQKERKVLEAALRVAEEELPVFERSAPAELAALATAKKKADEDLKYFLDVERAQIEKDVAMSLKSSKFYLEFAQEQLRQLEKMYKSNDLTEASEKMIILRQQNSVESAAFYYQRELLESEYILKKLLPYREKTLQENRTRQELNLEKATKTLTPMVVQKQTQLAKMRFEHEKVSTRLDKLQKDKAAMTIVSPMDGVVYHGKFDNGQWSFSDDLQSKLVPNGSIAADVVIMTVVKPRPMLVNLSIEEKDVYLLKPGAKGKATMVFNPQRKWPAQIAKISQVPSGPGKFDAEITLEIPAAEADLTPGLACTLKFVPYVNMEAIAVPVSCIVEEDDKYFIHVFAKNDKHEKREVTTGRTDGELTEILTGLQAGEEILLERPGRKGADKSSDAIKKGALR